MSAGASEEFGGYTRDLRRHAVRWVDGLTHIVWVQLGVAESVEEDEVMVGQPGSVKVGAVMPEQKG